MIAKPLINESLIDVLYRGPGKGEPFDRLLYTNPALLCVEVSLARMFIEMGIRPDYLLGYSLGEIAASVISEALSLDSGIQMAVDIARLAEQHTVPAEMLAIIESQQILLDLPHQFRECWVTGKNFEGNFVVSGLPGSIQRLQKELSNRNILNQKLPVTYGFHTELIDPMESEFKELAKHVKIAAYTIPTLSSFKSGLVSDVDESHFWDVLRQPVDFQSTVNRMLEQDDYIFIDVGPSGSLATFVKYLLPSQSKSIQLTTLNPFGRDVQAVDKLKSVLRESIPIEEIR
jgi:acyl transferase domain-containing protein